MLTIRTVDDLIAKQDVIKSGQDITIRLDFRRMPGETDDMLAERIKSIKDCLAKNDIARLSGSRLLQPSERRPNIEKL